jgi:hypothetical protein
MQRITFNGKTYNDVSEMPTAERQAYEQLMVHFQDQDGDGTPDIFQGDLVSNIINAVASTNIVVDGKRVGGFQNLTQEQRIKLEKGMSTLQKLGIIKDMPNLDGIHPPHPTAMPVWGDAQRPKSEPYESIEEPLPDWLNSEIRASEPIIPQNSVIQEDRTNSSVLFIVIGMILLAGLGVFVLFIIGG